MRPILRSAGWGGEVNWDLIILYLAVTADLLYCK